MIGCMGVGWRPQDQRDLSDTSHQGNFLSVWLVIIAVDLDRLAKVMFVSFPHCNLLFPLPLLIPFVLFKRKSLLATYTWGVRSEASPPGRQSNYTNYLEFFYKGNLPLLPYLFIIYHISVWTHRYLYLRLWSNITLFIYVVRIVPSLLTRSSFSRLLDPFHMSPLCITVCVCVCV